MIQPKFRGKTIDTESPVWVYGCLMIENPPLQCFAGTKAEPDKYLIGKSGFADWNMTRPFDMNYVEPISVGEFTGFQDKNKADIYTGDLFGTPVQLRCVVVRNLNGEFRLDFFDKRITSISIVDMKVVKSEIIGNVTDNPELLP